MHENLYGPNYFLQNNNEHGVSEIKQKSKILSKLSAKIIQNFKG